MLGVLTDGFGIDGRGSTAFGLCRSVAIRGRRRSTRSMLMLESRLALDTRLAPSLGPAPPGTRRVGEIVGERCGERSLPARRRLLSEPEAAIEAPFRGDEPPFRGEASRGRSSCVLAERQVQHLEAAKVFRQL